MIAELDGGADFEELAREKSTGPSGPSGGDLGWFPPDRMVPEFSQAVVVLANGEYTKSFSGRTLVNQHRHLSTESAIS